MLKWLQKLCGSQKIFEPIRHCEPEMTRRKEPSVANEVYFYEQDEIPDPA